MSTKIYLAWKIPVSRLNDFIDDISKYMIGKVQQKLVRIFDNFDDEKFIKKQQEGKSKGEKIKIRKHLKNPRYLFFDKLYFIFKMARDSAKTSDSSLCDFQCGIKFWIRKGYAYIIPWGEFSFYDKYKAPAWAKDYSYWNNTDKPDEISASAWKTRQRIWDTMIDNPHDEAKYRMVCYISNFQPLAVATEVQLTEYMKKKYGYSK